MSIIHIICLLGNLMKLSKSFHCLARGVNNRVKAEKNSQIDVVKNGVNISPTTIHFNPVSIATSVSNTTITDIIDCI